jgi:predicted ArsR family transcriptional regulator
MKSTRQRLLDILKNRPNTTAAELSRALQLTQADVRHHLSNMIAEGLVIATGYQRGGRRGRPAQKFSIATAALNNNFDLLSSALLTVSLQNLSPSDRLVFLRHVAAQLVGENTSGGPLAQRLVGAVVRLSELGYQARWEAHAEAPRLILEHCPFASLLPKHPECLYARNLTQGTRRKNRSTRPRRWRPLYFLGWKNGCHIKPNLI